jgi:hypothetical protein
MPGRRTSTAATASPLPSESAGWGVGDCGEAVRRAHDVLGNATCVTWLCVFPAGGMRDVARVHVMVDCCQYVHALAELSAEAENVPAYSDGNGRTDPSRAGRINGIWLHVTVDPDATGGSHREVA